MRTRQPLIDAWSIRQLPETIPDVAGLSRAAAAPGDTWLTARMPAQVHDVLLAHSRIADPRVGRNAATVAWVGEQNWAYTCTFVTPTCSGYLPHPTRRHDRMRFCCGTSSNGTLVRSAYYSRRFFDIADDGAGAMGLNQPCSDYPLCQFKPKKYGHG